MEDFLRFVFEEGGGEGMGIHAYGWHVFVQIQFEKLIVFALGVSYHGQAE